MENRDKYRKGLSQLYLPVYDGICGDLGEKWQPYCGVRTFVEQDALWSKGRTTAGSMVTNARGGESPHNYGMATDWTIFVDGKPEWPTLHDSVWDEYREVVWKHGATWGGDWKDGPHNEIKITPAWKWRMCLPYWQAGGQLAVENYVRSMMK